SIDATRHNVFVFREADSTKNRADTWKQASILDAGSSTCVDGTTGTRLTLTMTNAGKLDSVSVGGPVRIWEQVKYLLYDDGTGTRWLGTSTWQSGAWTATSAVAGPLAPSGITFTFYDSTGAVTATASSVASVGMTVRGQSLRP